MPEMHFSIRWPDGSVERCYSPSLVVRDFLAEGAAYPLPKFLMRTREALLLASNRVKAQYGFPCGRALSQLSRIEEQAARFAPDSVVTVERLEEAAAVLPGGRS
ncbi:MULTISPECIES: MSMEG_0570 family nitrogen starvation response protein [Rhodomicrobium]|uniref:MSMEG_0570 family nitrogen starvation response protein n=1 Tax=Rhodomicrobium TaxID=1068 RepID=UPI000B4A98F1|nr:MULTISPECIES: MSMEG_0570 family nitrogen starvation response protein [Rhodomicrobium]